MSSLWTQSNTQLPREAVQLLFWLYSWFTMGSEASYSEGYGKSRKQIQTCLWITAIADYHITDSVTNLFFFSLPYPFMNDTGWQLLWHENLRRISIGSMASLQWVRISVGGSLMCSPNSLHLTLIFYVCSGCMQKTSKIHTCAHFCKANLFSRTSDTNQANIFASLADVCCTV